MDYNDEQIGRFIEMECPFCHEWFRYEGPGIRNMECPVCGYGSDYKDYYEWKDWKEKKRMEKDEAKGC